MSTSPSVRARIHAATAANYPLAVAPTVKQSDVYEREAIAICTVGSLRSDVIYNIQQRMALEIVCDTDEQAVFEITQSTKYNQMIVFFKDSRLVSVTLQQDGNDEEHGREYEGNGDREEEAQPARAALLRVADGRAHPCIAVRIERVEALEIVGCEARDRAAQRRRVHDRERAAIE